jgi:UDP-2,4-diacetamido-2,4,6-trideoxy-beta-L-altropyranose hydrolase
MKHLLIRADATAQIGTGHVMRGLALAQAWQERGGRAVFLSHCESEELKGRILSDDFALIHLERSHPDPFDLEYTAGILQRLGAQPETRDAWLVVDGYHLDGVYQKEIKKIGYPLLMIDDYGHVRHCNADVVLNQNISATRFLYNNCAPDTVLLLGPRYTLIRREFQPWRDQRREFPDVARRILVTMGGADPNNLTLEVLRALRRLTLPDLEVKVVIGHANPHYGSIQKECSGAIPHFQLLFSVKEIPELMAWSDLAIIQAGGTLWELLFMGCAIISYATNVFQDKVLKTLDEMNVLKYNGYSNEIDQDLLLSSIYGLALDKERRKELFKLGRDIIDGQGADRVVEQICRWSG